MARRRQKPAVVLSTEQVEALLRSFSKAPTSVRNRALVAVLWRCGLKLGEALALRPVDIDRRKREITVTARDDRSRVVGISAGALVLVDDWLRVRSEAVKVGQRKVGARGPLFCTLQGQPLTQDYVRQFLQRKATKAGLPWVNPQGLRSAFAAELAGRGVDAVTLQKLLGHSSLLVTSRLLHRLRAGDPMSVVRDDGWRFTDPGAARTTARKSR